MAVVIAHVKPTSSTVPALCCGHPLCLERRFRYFVLQFARSKIQVDCGKRGVLNLFRGPRESDGPRSLQGWARQALLRGFLRRLCRPFLCGVPRPVADAEGVPETYASRASALEAILRCILRMRRVQKSSSLLENGDWAPRYNGVDQPWIGSQSVSIHGSQTTEPPQ